MEKLMCASLLPHQILHVMVWSGYVDIELVSSKDHSSDRRRKNRKHENELFMTGKDNEEMREEGGMTRQEGKGRRRCNQTPKASSCSAGDDMT